METNYQEKTSDKAVILVQSKILMFIILPYNKILRSYRIKAIRVIK